MWKQIKNNQDIADFMARVCYFHDSCIKEIHYLSGSYVDKELSMYPINDQRRMRVVIQRQYREMTAIEMVFSGLVFARIVPADEDHTCEILDASLFQTEQGICWCDCGSVSLSNMDSYDGTVIHALELCWREIEAGAGSKKFFVSSV